MKQTIVSLTPLALEKDSRTLKMAASFVRFGYRSVVVELNKSTGDFGYLGVEVVSVKNGLNDGATLSFYKRIFKEILISIANSMYFVGLGWMSSLIVQDFFKKKYSLKKINIPKADIYFFHSYSYVSFALSLPSQSRIVYDAHDFYQDLMPENMESQLMKKCMLPLSKKHEEEMIDVADVFTTVSQGIARKHKDFFGRESLTIMNSHDFRNDINDNESVRSYLNLSSSDIIVCSVGHKKPGAALEHVIDVFGKELNHIHLVFIGDGYDIGFCQYHNIHFVPARKPNKLVSFIRSANFGIVTYFALTEDYKFALPNRFFQMIAAGLPLVFSNSLVEIVNLNNKYNFGIGINIYSVEEVKKSVLTMINDQGGFRQGLIFAASMLNWEVEEKKLRSIIESMYVKK